MKKNEKYLVQFLLKNTGSLHQLLSNPNIEVIRSSLSKIDNNNIQVDAILSESYLNELKPAYAFRIKENLNESLAESCKHVSVNDRFEKP
ncbi:MAG: hypothetical protein K9H26_15425 [Prolixibacteraceae bacterium]|nr:hypothetical protein [Prolixibacteraceae bacterium]